MTSLLERIKAELISLSDEKNRLGARRYFKEDIKLYGVSTWATQKLAKSYLNEIKNMDKSTVLDLCGKLWQSGYMEESFIACQWSFAIRKKFTESDIEVFEKWINNHVTNWASCDTFCNHTVGSFMEMYPEYIARLKKWAMSPNRWMRRAGAVSLIVPAKRGKFLKDVFAIADILLVDKDDLVQKGYGWLLKVASQAHQKEVFDYVMAHKQVMPRTALRYALEKMPSDLRKQAMAK